MLLSVPFILQNLFMRPAYGNDTCLRTNPEAQVTGRANGSGVITPALRSRHLFYAYIDNSLQTKTTYFNSIIWIQVWRVRSRKYFKHMWLKIPTATSIYKTRGKLTLCTSTVPGGLVHTKLQYCDTYLVGKPRYMIHSLLTNKEYMVDIMHEPSILIQHKLHRSTLRLRI